MKRIFVPTKSGTDWQRLLGKPNLHWKKGRSAMTAAACWEESQPHLPSEITQILDRSKDQSISGLELLVAFPEWEVELPGGDTASQTDILAIARNQSGLVVLGVEAKVDEPFGPTLGEKKSGASKGQLDRILYLEQELGRSTPFNDHIRYQLLHRTVSALLTARDFHASVAVMLVHSFSPEPKWRDDFEGFCQELGCTCLTQDLFEVPGKNRPRLILGWCKGNEKYLSAELPSEFEKNKSIATRIIEDFINKNNLAAADELFADDFVNHSPQFGVTPDREGIKQMITLFHKAFPDIHLTIEDMVAENDKVVLRMRSTGTNTGEFLGIQPTNKRMDSCQISIIRIEDGKVMERWNITDQLEVMRQLGWM